MSLSDEQTRGIADLIRTAATWVDGERTVKLLAAAHQLEGADEAEATRLANQELYDQSIAAAQSSTVIDEQAAQQAKDAFDNAPKASETSPQGGLFQPGVPSETPAAAPTDGSSQGAPADQAGTLTDPTDTTSTATTTDGDQVPVSTQPTDPTPAPADGDTGLPVVQQADQPEASTDASTDAPADQPVTSDGTPVDLPSTTPDTAPPVDQDASAGTTNPADDSPIYSQTEQTSGDPSIDTTADSSSAADSTDSGNTASADPAAQ